MKSIQSFGSFNRDDKAQSCCFFFFLLQVGLGFLKINQAFRCTAKYYKVSSSCDSLSDIAGPSQGDHIHLRSQFKASSSGSI